MVELAVPAGADSICVPGGVVSTIQDRLAGERSVFCAGSTARTLKVCGPWRRPETLFGETHAENPAPSSEQSNVDPASVDEKVRVASLEFTCPEGPESMDVFGAVTSEPSSTKRTNALDGLP